MVKHLPAIQETQLQYLGWVRKIPLEKGIPTYSNILAWRIPCQRSLEGYSPQGHKELDTTERLHLYIYMGFLGGSDGKESACNAGDLGLIPGWGRSPGEGNGNPL